MPSSKLLGLNDSPKHDSTERSLLSLLVRRFTRASLLTGIAHDFLAFPFSRSMILFMANAIPNDDRRRPL